MVLSLVRFSGYLNYFYFDCQSDNNKQRQQWVAENSALQTGFHLFVVVASTAVVVMGIVVVAVVLC